MEGNNVEEKETERDIETERNKEIEREKEWDRERARDGEWERKREREIQNLQSVFYFISWIWSIFLINCFWDYVTFVKILSKICLRNRAFS